MNLIVIQGPPAAGKTTLARKLSKDLAYGFASKDSFKELLFDTLGVPNDRDMSRVYGNAATAMMYRAIDTGLLIGRNMVVESAFYPQLAQEDFANINRNNAVNILQVYCQVSPETLASRYNDRLREDERHIGHLDTERDAAYVTPWIELYTSIPGLSTIELDMNTLDEPAYDRLLEDIRVRMAI